MSAAERASGVNSVEQANERAVRVNERTEERMTQYSTRRFHCHLPHCAQVPKTIENQREKDETMITTADEEVEAMEALDEMSGFFNRETPPKILITTADHGSHRTIKFARDLADVVPNAKYYYRCLGTDTAQWVETDTAQWVETV